MNKKLTLILVFVISVAHSSFGMKGDGKIYRVETKDYIFYSSETNSGITTCVKSKKYNSIDGYRLTRQSVGAILDPEEDYGDLEKEYALQEKAKEKK